MVSPSCTTRSAAWATAPGDAGGVAGDPQRDRQPRGASGVDDLADEAEVGAAVGRGVLGEQVGETVEVGLGLTGRGGDDVEGLGRAGGLADGQSLARARLHDHHRDRVGDDVVQLGGDPGPLVADRQAGVGVALGLELVGLLRPACRRAPRGPAGRGRPGRG